MGTAAISHRVAFRIGCLEPDKNPSTYLKGFRTGHFFQGHNWNNSLKTVYKTGELLARKKRFNVIDYYLLGRIIHYISDGFTYAHNIHFGRNLPAHIAYEAQLETYFRTELSRPLILCDACHGTLLQILHRSRMNYLLKSSCPTNDARFIKHTCCEIMCFFSSLPQSSNN